MRFRPKSQLHPYAYSSLPHANAMSSEDQVANSAPVRLSPPVYIYRCQQCTELGPTHRSQASRFYSTDKSVMNKYCFQTYTSYPSMGFDPLQGTKQIAIPVSLTDDMFALHSHIARRDLADTMFSRLSTKTIPFLLTAAPVNENLRLHHRHWSP